MKVKWPHIDAIQGLTDHQREQLSRATAGPVGIFAGKPGSGKTHSTAAMIRNLVDEHGSWRIAVAAPTGKAAVRCTAAMKDRDLNIEATTIHRLLGVQRSGHGGRDWGFRYNSTNPLPHKFIIIDESSMVDTDLCGSLISATEPGTHVLFCGDVYQLPPVGHGAPLRDMIAANLPYGELSEPHRQGGKITDIVRVCDELTRGLPYQPSRWIDRPRGMNVLHVEATRPVIILEQLKRMLTTLPAEIDPFSDVQILCAVNDVGELGRTTVNLLVQEWLNPHGKKVAGCPFRLGDKVICTSNTVLTVIPKEQSGGVVNGSRDKIEDFVANGEIGRVVHVEEKLFHVKFDAPARTVAVPVFATKSEESNTATGKAGEKAGSGCDFSLGYAVTVHKAQGSQWKIPISLIDSYPGARMVCSRELWVTAISRAEVMPITIGRRDILNRDCQKVALKLRKTFLRELITEGMATSV